jgi:hypothetical protein
MPLFCMAAKPDYLHHSWPSQGITTQRGDKTTKSSNNWRRKHPSTHDSCPTECRCRFFLWDFVSCYKYHETISLAQQHTFEGKGGKKFVRLQPNTTLERWYPQLKMGHLKTNGCLLCGHSYKDHLDYWWYCRRKKGDVSEFDRFITNSVADCDFKRNSFHRNYVEEVDESSTSSRRRKGQEVRKSVEAGVTFMVPRFDPLADGRPKSIGSVLILSLARIQSLVKVEDLIWLSKFESVHSEKKLS